MFYFNIGTSVALNALVGGGYNSQESELWTFLLQQRV